MRTRIYVDGFNLYYGSLRGSRWKWLNLDALCKNVLQKQHVIEHIRYFTARTKPTQHNPGQAIRQETYLRALRTLPHVTIHLGSFQSNVCKRPRASDGVLVEVIDTKEKGSDVNLASFLLRDGFRGEYDSAVVISNDSDLAEPIRMVRNELKLSVGILNPHKKHAFELKNIPPKFHMEIKPVHLAASQFSPTLTDANGTITKPAQW